MNVCVDVYLKNCWLLMLTNEYEYNEFGTKAFYEKLKCLLTDVISYFVVFTYQDGNLVAQLVALFKLVAQMLAFCCFSCIFRRCHSKYLEVDQLFARIIICSVAAQVSCWYVSSTFGMVTFGTYISKSSYTIFTLYKFQINSRMNNSYDQRYISIEFTIERNHKMISMHFIELDSRYNFDELRRSISGSIYNQKLCVQICILLWKEIFLWMFFLSIMFGCQLIKVRM